MIKQLDLFAGAGAFALAGERHGVKSVMSVEIDKYCCKTLNHNFKDMEVWNNDIRELTTDYVSKHHGKIDIITSGFPCTSYSIAGKRKGFDDPRTGDLFDQTLRFVYALKPKIFIFENVKGLLNHDYGRTFAAMLIRMGELGCYEIEWQVLNSKNFGVPQNRERVFIVGHLRGEGGGKVFPIEATNRNYTKIKKINSAYKSNKEIIGTLCAVYHKIPTDGQYIEHEFVSHKGHKNKPMKHHGQVCPTLTAEAHGHLPMVAVQNGHSQQNGKGWNDENFFCLDTTSGCGQGVGVEKKKSMIRRLTPLECQRLQGFPDDWYKGLDMSDTQIYKQMGNSITVNVLEEIYKTKSFKIKNTGAKNYE